MRKFLKSSLGLLTLIMTFFLVGCTEEDFPDLDFKFKTLKEYASDINNLTVTMDVEFQGKQSNYLFTNDGKVFVNSVTDYSGQEYGYVYDSRDNSLYGIDRGHIDFLASNDSIIDNVASMISDSYILFFTSLKDPKISYIGTEVVNERKCHRYKAIVNEYGIEYTYLLSIDDETELCLRCHCITDGESYVYFSTKRFSYEPLTSRYINLIEDYKNSKLDNNLDPQ